ncbi:MAG: response regulator [Pseudomonadota bacterium]|nr:response regulator [Pseudomonadota bacterium]
MKRSRESIRALVVDDEAPARKRLTDMLARDRDVGKILEARNGVAAVAIIQEERPDVVFLDVQMPGVDGFGVIEALGADNMPLTVFVTGHDRFAIQAFEADAIDYLLKPFADTRYEQMMERVKKRLHEAGGGATGSNLLGSELLQLASRRFKPGQIWQWMVVKTKDSTRLVMTEDIDWIEAAGVYVTLHVANNEFLYRASLAEVATRLDPLQFVRIHRSSVVNLRSIAFLERRSHREFEVALKSGARLMLSRSYREHVETMLGQSL